MPEFDSAGVRLRYHLAGPDDGPPIVLVHGFCSDYHLNWVGSRWQHTLTEDGRLVIGLDCRGHGGSEKPHDPAAYARTEMAADVIRLLDHLGVERADYLGYSMGARIALDAVVAHPGRFDRLVLGGVGRLGSGRGAELIARRLRGDEDVTLPQAELFYRFASAHPGNDLEALACCILGAQPRIEDAHLATIRNPVLVVVGDQDFVLADAREVAAEIPGAGLVELPGRNHMNAMPARQFKEATVAFLNA